MTTAAKNVFEQARKLSTEEFAELVDMLIVESADHPDRAIQCAWEEEIERRVDSYKTDKSRARDGNTFFSPPSGESA